MLNHDRAAKKAEELLPHTEECPANYRPAVAAELREAYDRGWLEGGKAAMERGFIEKEAEIARLKGKLNRKDDEYEQQCKHEEAEIARLRAELQHWREAAASVGQPDGHGWAEETNSLRAELASIEQFAESWPCHCAENYPGATMYHGQDCQTAIAVEFVAQWCAAKVKP